MNVAFILAAFLGMACAQLGQGGNIASQVSTATSGKGGFSSGSGTANANQPYKYGNDGLLARPSYPSGYYPGYGNVNANARPYGYPGRPRPRPLPRPSKYPVYNPGYGQSYEPPAANIATQESNAFAGEGGTAIASGTATAGGVPSLVTKAPL